MNKVLFGLPKAAEAIGMDVRALRSAIDRGEVPGIRIGRLYKVPLWWIEHQRNGPRAEAM